jgi:hypothetical protein
MVSIEQMNAAIRAYEREAEALNWRRQAREAQKPDLVAPRRGIRTRLAAMFANRRTSAATRAATRTV